MGVGEGVVVGVGVAGAGVAAEMTAGQLNNDRSRTITAWLLFSYKL